MTIKTRQRILDFEYAKRLGVELKSERESKNLTVGDVADKLLLSRHQIVGLEQGVHTFFYGVKIYAQAADKYSKFLGLPGNPSDFLLLSPLEVPKPENSESLVSSTPLPADVKTPNPHLIFPERTLSWAMVWSALFFVGVVFIVFNFDTSRSAEADKSERAYSSSSVRSSGISDNESSGSIPRLYSMRVGLSPNQIELRFDGECWVQFVQKGKSPIQQTYQAGDTLKLDTSNLQQLVIGNAQVTTIESARGLVNLEPYQQVGGRVARITDFRTGKLNSKP